MIIHLISQTLKGKTVNRLLMNDAVREISLSGQVLDLGAGTIRSSYFEFFQKAGPMEVTSVDMTRDRKPDVVADLEQGIPLADQSFDSVLCFNLLEHIFNHERLIGDSYRVLKPGGRLVGYVPFLVNFHPDPFDYFRYTRQALERLMQNAGFRGVVVTSIGRGPVTAAWSQIAYILPRLVRWPITLIAFGLDRLLVRLKPAFGRLYPLGYLFVCER